MRKTFKSSVSDQRVEYLSRPLKEIEQTRATLPNLGLSSNDIQNVALGCIQENPFQPRKQYDDGSLQSLAASIEEQGLLQPVLGRPNPDGTFTLIAGHRRFRAAQLLGQKTIKLLPREATDAELRVLALVENLERQDLHVVEKVKAFAELVPLFPTQEEAARSINLKRTTFLQWLRAGNLNQSVCDICLKITGLSLRSLNRIADLPPAKQLTEANRLLSLQEKAPTSEPGPAPPKSGIKPRIFKIVNPQKRFKVEIILKTKNRKHALTDEDVRESLLGALAELEAQMSS